MRYVRLRRADTIFACQKCLKRHDDGKTIRRALKAQAKSADAMLVRASCLGICPKRAVVIFNRASIADGRVVLVSDAAEIEDALAALRVACASAG